MTRRWSIIPTAIDILGEGDDRLTMIECDATDQDCIVDWVLLVDHNLCFIIVEDC